MQRHAAHEEGKAQREPVAPDRASRTIRAHGARQITHQQRKLDHKLEKIREHPDREAAGTGVPCDFIKARCLNRVVSNVSGTTRPYQAGSTSASAGILRALVKVEGLSADRRCATAYNAALQAANMAIACAGYRVTAKVGHHKVTVDCMKLALGGSAGEYADYFETCRRKRNMIGYTRSHVATETEAKEILQGIQPTATRAS